MIVYQYDAASKEVRVTRNPSGANQQFVLLRNVTAFTVSIQPMQSATGRYQYTWDLVRRATVLLTVKLAATGPGIDPNQTITLSTAVMPRQNTL